MPVEYVEFEPGGQAAVIHTGRSRVQVRGEAAVRLRARLEQECIDLARLNEATEGRAKENGLLDVA